METTKTVRLLPSRFVSAKLRVYKKSFHKIWHKVDWIRWWARCSLFGEAGAPCFALAASSHWCSKLLKVGRFAVGQVNDTDTPFRSIPLSNYPPVLHPKSESSLQALNPIPAGPFRGVRGFCQTWSCWRTRVGNRFVPAHFSGSDDDTRLFRNGCVCDHAFGRFLPACSFTNCRTK